MSLSVSTQTATATIDWSLGWRYETVRTPDGKQTQVRIPLTPEEARHPQEGYVIPVSTLHETITNDLCDMLRAHYDTRPEITIFHDLVFQWDHPAVKSYAPDVAIVPHVRNPKADRGQFVVAEERTRPHRYLPMLPDEDGALYGETLGLRIGVEDGQVWLEDSNTGDDLLTNLKARQALRETAERLQAEVEARAAAEERARQEAQARQEAEAEIARLQALLAQKTDQ
ncbi:MAG: hypothetical protein DYG89_54890 [Caldilinea sp. CFX5]|nr:hypothetical protein [Caldilinea sp. CFX5]